MAHPGDRHAAPPTRPAVRGPGRNGPQPPSGIPPPPVPAHTLAFTTAVQYSRSVALALETILERTGARPCGRGWLGHCPAHDDRRPSLGIRSANGRIYLKCFAGCSRDAIWKALGTAPPGRRAATAAASYRRALLRLFERERRRLAQTSRRVASTARRLTRGKTAESCDEATWEKLSALYALDPWPGLALLREACPAQAWEWVLFPERRSEIEQSYHEIWNCHLHDCAFTHQSFDPVLWVQADPERSRRASQLLNGGAA